MNGHEQQIFNAWKKFQKNGFKRRDFTQKLYKFLSANFGFWGHSSRYEFYKSTFVSTDHDGFMRTQYMITNKNQIKEGDLEYQDLRNAISTYAEKNFVDWRDCPRMMSLQRDLSVINKLMEKHKVHEIDIRGTDVVFRGENGCRIGQISRTF